MKAKELMIGDWVNIIIVGYDNPVQIKEIGQFWVKVTQDDEDYGVSLVQPILLTPEILEKNGWVKNLYSAESYDNEELEHLSLWVGEDGKNKWWWHVGVELVTPINYVHEFQHALRLCGIEKEIIL